MTRLGQVLFVLTALAVLIPSSKSAAQEPGKAVGGLQIAKVSGTMQAAQLNQIKFVGEDKKEYFAVFSNQTSLHYKGTAEPDFLVPGLLVRFSAELNQSGLAQGPVNELEIFTFNQSRRLSPEQVREQTAGVYQVDSEVANGKKPADKPDKNAEKATAKKTGASGKDVQKYRVVGQFAGAKQGKMFVQAGSVQVQFELDPKAAIKVTSYDPTFSQIGDQIKVSGLRMSGQEQFIQCESLEIIGAKPLEPAQGKTAKNAKPTRATKGKGAKSGTEKDGEAADDKKIEPKKTSPKK